MIFPLLLTYSLLGVDVLKKDLLREMAETEVPSQSFGVFVTLKRHHPQKGAGTVHGCIGNWSINYDSLSPEKVVLWAEKLALDARYKDQRRFQFDTDIENDESTTVELNIMRLPLFSINPDTGIMENGEVFDNGKYGVIVQLQGQRATYLPHVFEEKSWHYIQQSLTQKANIGLGHYPQFFAYKTRIQEFKIADVLFSAEATRPLLLDVAWFYQKHYIDFVPYEYDQSEHVATVDKTQEVRNLGCIADVLWLQNQFPGIIQDKPVWENLDGYYQLWTSGYLSTQASIFLIKAYMHLLKRNREVMLIKRLALLQDNLYMNLHTLEPQFSLGEAVSTLAPLVNGATRSFDMNKLFEACDRMRQRLDTLPLDIFELNWQSQSVYHMLPVAEWGRPSAVPWLQALQAKIQDKVLQVLLTMHTDFSRYETNVLAVAYECVSHLGLDTSYKYQLYTELLQNRRGAYGLYYFNNSTRARLDLTGHVMNAI